MTKWDADKEALRQRVDALLCRIQDVEAKLDKLIKAMQDEINGRRALGSMPDNEGEDL